MNRQQQYILAAALLLILLMVFILSQPVPQMPVIPDVLLEKPKKEIVVVKEQPQQYYDDEFYVDGGYYLDDGFYVDNIIRRSLDRPRRPKRQNIDINLEISNTLPPPLPKENNEDSPPAIGGWQKGKIFGKPERIKPNIKIRPPPIRPRQPIGKPKQPPKMSQPKIIKQKVISSEELKPLKKNKLKLQTIN